MQQLDPLIVNKIISFCEYQERCETDVKKKLHDLEVKDMAPYLQRLREARFVDDVRFTRMFISSRHKRRGWGKNKLLMELRKKNISKDIYQPMLDELEEGEDYMQTIQDAATKKWKSVKGKSLMERKSKLIRFLLTKGFEMDKVRAVVSKITE
jgi:regulatory protein